MHKRRHATAQCRWKNWRRLSGHYLYVGSLPVAKGFSEPSPKQAAKLGCIITDNLARMSRAESEQRCYSHEPVAAGIELLNRLSFS